jgi:hypothetical protein
MWILILGMTVAAQKASSAPTNAAPPVITDISMVPRLTIQGAVGTTNQIQYCTNLSQLSQTNWIVLTNLVVAQSNYWFVDVTAPPSPQRFYRVLIPGPSTTNSTVTLNQLWGSAGQNVSATTPIQRSSIPTPVNTSTAAFDATHSSIWIPVSYVPAWSVGTVVYWGSTPYSMRVSALGSGEILFKEVSGGYFGWSPGTVIATSFGYTLTNVVTAAGDWITPGMSNTIPVSASAVTGNVGDVVWAGANQFRILSIVK